MKAQLMEIFPDFSYFAGLFREGKEVANAISRQHFRQLEKFFLKSNQSPH
jgi:hypothetical protein